MKKNQRRTISSFYLLVTLIAVTVVTRQCVHTLVAALIDLHLGAFVHIAVCGLIGLIGAVGHLVAHQTVIDTLAIRAGELSLCTLCHILLLAVHLVRVISTIVLAIATILIPYALEVLACELHRRTCLVFRIAELALVGAVAAVIIVITNPALRESISTVVGILTTFSQSLSAYLIDAASIATGEHVLAARLLCCAIMQRCVLIGTINAVRITVTDPFLGYALGTLP